MKQYVSSLQAKEKLMLVSVLAGRRSFSWKPKKKKKRMQWGKTCQRGTVRTAVCL